MRCLRAVLAASVLLLAFSPLFAPVRGDNVAERARKLHFSSIVLDTHDDTPQRFFSKTYDLAKHNPDGHIDIPRMREGAAEGKLPHVGWERIIEHIDHLVKLVGPDYVGLGSDFDGATMPEGMDDCAHLPKITEALMRQGYSSRNIRKILGGNLLRVMEQNETVARELQAQL